MKKNLIVLIFVFCTSNEKLFSQINLALNKTAAASSEYPGRFASAANDGNSTTSWAAFGGSFPQWITIDLGRISSLTEIKNTFLNLATWFYKIEGSNTNASQDFHMLADRTGTGVAGKTIIEAVTGNYRYVRFYITGCSVTGAWASSTELEIKGNVFSQPTGLVPAIEAVSSGDYLIGAQMCNLWGSQYHWDVIRNPYIHNGRMPLMGWFDESYDVSTDWQIKMAREHGISFFMPCWYRGFNNAGKAVISQYDHFINSIANTASYRDRMKWAIQWINQNSVSGVTSCSGLADFAQNIVPYWINNYFNKPNYLKIDNKPVISIYDVDKFISDCGGATNAATAITELRTQCINAGYCGVVVMVSYVTATKNLHAGRSIGADFAYSYHVPTFTELYLVANATNTQVIGWQDTAWANYSTYSGSPYITSASAGWDSKPWGGFFRWQFPSSDYLNLLQVAKTRANSQPSKSIQSKMILLDNWNEFGEGHYITPTLYYGYSYLDAVRDVFTNGGPHTDVMPDMSTIPQLEPVPPVNLAFKKSVTTSSYSVTGYEGNKIVDGSGEYTKWVAAGPSFPQWVNVDLGDTFNVAQVKTIFYHNDTWKYKIEGSLDNSTWSLLADNTTSGRTGMVLDDTISGVCRFVKLTITQAGNAWASVWELEVFGGGQSFSIAKAINLSGQILEEGNLLEWNAAGADVSGHFQIERSTDGVNFQKIDVLQSDIIRMGNNYQYVDFSPPRGINYYRVNMVEKGRPNTQSNRIVLNTGENNNFSLSLGPNPSNRIVYLEITGERGYHAKADIMNLSGNLVRTIVIQGNSVKIDIGNLPASTYIIKYSDSKRVSVRKILKIQ